MAENRPGVMLYFETLQAIEELDAEDVKLVMSAILHYCRDGEEPAFHGMPAALWHMIRGCLDRDGERYSTRRLRGIWLTYCRKCKEEGSDWLSFEEWVSVNSTSTECNDTLRYVEQPVYSAVNGTQPSTTTSPTTTPAPTSIPSSYPSPAKKGADKPPLRPRFTPPTVEEVRAYCRERGNHVDPERFMDYYTANGWKVGRNPMKDWRACVRNWEKERGTGTVEATQQTANPLRGFHMATEDEGDFYRE